MLQMALRAVLTTKMTVITFYKMLLVCVHVTLLITVFHQTHYTEDVPPSSQNTLTFVAHSAIRSTKQSLYVMHGEGNFTDTDEHLLRYIRSMMSWQGPGGRHLYSNSSRVDFSQVGGAGVVDRLQKRRRNGFFVECGAFVGEQLSDTLFFELKRNWTGILIEAHPQYHHEILKKNRRALVLRACLSHSPRPGLVKFKLAGWGSGVSDLNKNVEAPDIKTDVQCFSLNSIMAAIGVNHIDFFVLDVEGSELSVLETIDFRRLSIDVFSVEYSDYQRTRKLANIRQFFKKTGGYREVSLLPLGMSAETAQDVIFMRV